MTLRRCALALVGATLATLALPEPIFAEAASRDEMRTRLSFERVLYREPGMLGVALQPLNGVLYLVGEVPSESARLEAEALTRRMYVQREVRNRLRVADPAALHDAFALEAPAILAKIQAALEADDELRPFRRHLEIEVEQRRAVAAGEVGTLALALRLIALLRGIPGLVAIDADGLRYPPVS